MTRPRIDGCTVRVEQSLGLGPIETSHVYPADLRQPSRVIDEVFPVRQDDRCSMIPLSWFELAGGC